MGTSDLQHAALFDRFDEVAKRSLYRFVREVAQVEQVHAAHEGEAAGHACREDVIVDSADQALADVLEDFMVEKHKRPDRAANRSTGKQPVQEPGHREFERDIARAQQTANIQFPQRTLSVEDSNRESSGGAVHGIFIGNMKAQGDPGGGERVMELERSHATRHTHVVNHGEPVFHDDRAGQPVQICESPDGGLLGGGVLGEKSPVNVIPDGGISQLRHGIRSVNKQLAQHGILITSPNRRSLLVANFRMT